ncbi:hypothetical protein D3C76_626240 [compost metagenome]
MARGLAPVGLRSNPEFSDPVLSGTPQYLGLATASQSNGGKPPRHKGVQCLN